MAIDSQEEFSSKVPVAPLHIQLSVILSAVRGRWDGFSKPSGWWPDNPDGYYNCSLGDWAPDPQLYPDGLKPVADAVHAAGLRMMLWFECATQDCLA